MDKNSEKKYISVAELAKLLGISRIAVFKRIKKGQIPAEKIGRSYAIVMTDVDQMINNKGPQALSAAKKAEITKAVEKVVKEYGQTLKLLGKE